MFYTKVKKNHAILFDNGEIFIAVAEITKDDNCIIWYVPKTINQAFKKYVSKIIIYDIYDSNIIRKYINFFSKHLNIPTNKIKVMFSIYYYQNIIFEDLNPNIKYNNEDKLNDIVKNSFYKEYIKPDQKATAYINNKKIVSIAFDNCNGSVSIMTLPEYRNKGYASECLKRLILEYNKNNKRLEFSTTNDNASSIRVAEKCGMKIKSYGYWVSIDKEIGKNFYKQNKELFK